MVEKKTIWGSTRYFIRIEPNTNLFSTSMDGLVSFYDTGGLINHRECNNLHEIVRTVQEFWSTILPPHETRVARWVEEYFTELGIQNDYNIILRLIKSEELIEQRIEDLILETTVINTAHFEEVFETDEKSKIIGVEVSTTHIPDDTYIQSELIQKLIEDNKYQVPNEVKSGKQFKLTNGETKNIDTNNSIDIGDSIGDITISSRLKNEYNEAITDIKIVDEIPYCFSIDDMTIEGIDIKPVIKKKEKILEIEWKIPEITPGSKAEIKYKMKQKINRTILEIIENKINVFNTFEEIVPSGLEFVANTKYINAHKKIVEELHIMDELPPEFDVLKSNPEAIPPRGIIEKARLKGVNIRWQQKNINPGQILEKTYSLDYFPYLFRGKKIVKDAEGNIILKAAKFIQPIDNEIGYRLVYILKCIRDVEEIISIEDAIPISHVITTKDPPDDQVMEQTNDEGKRIITWIADPPAKEQEKLLMIQISGDTQPLFETFKIYIGDKKETEIIKKESSIAREMTNLSW